MTGRREKIFGITFLLTSIAYLYLLLISSQLVKSVIKKNMKLTSDVLYVAQIMALNIEKDVDKRYQRLLRQGARNFRKVKNSKDRIVLFNTLNIDYAGMLKNDSLLIYEDPTSWNIFPCLETIEEVLSSQYLNCNGMLLYIYRLPGKAKLILGISSKRIDMEKQKLGLAFMFKEMAKLPYLFYVALQSKDSIWYSTISKRLLSSFQTDSLLFEAYLTGEDFIRKLNIYGKPVIEMITPFSYHKFRGIMRVGVDATPYQQILTRLRLEITLLYVLILVLLGSVYLFLRRIEQTRRQKEILDEQLREYKMFSKMLHEIAHEIKNPLNGINLLIQSLKLEEDREEYSAIEEQVKRIKHALDKFTVLVSPIRINAECISQKELLEKALKLAGITDPEKVEIVGEDFKAKVDKEKFIEVFLNLIKNAVEIPNFKRLRIILKPMRVIFFNEGDHIPENILNRIFEPFFTTKKEGTGMGLHFVRKVIKAHDGDIKIRNTKEGVEVEVIYNESLNC